MSSSSEFFIFRDSRRSVLATELVAELRAELRQVVSPTGADALSSFLLRAGELETASLATRPAPLRLWAASLLTDFFADALVQCDLSALGAAPIDWRCLASSALRILDRIRYSGALSVGVPEGFAYYAIHPFDYATWSRRRKASSLHRRWWSECAASARP